ncbi:MAG: OmpH family outer membrane protein [Nitrospirae bacterium]|nr:MAG: OmpH family outer membrane protein [Nitrospirota bacterium]
MRYHMGLVMSKQKMWFRKASLLASPLMTLLLSSFLVAIAAPAETAELKVAVIDSMKIIEGTNAGKKMNESLKDYIAARQKILDTDADDLKKREEELSVQGSALSAQARQERENAARLQLTAYQRKSQQFNQEVEEKKRNLLQAFTRRLEAVTRRIAEKEQYALVLDKADRGTGTLVAYSKNAVDLTDQVIKDFDKEAK